MNSVALASIASLAALGAAALAGQAQAATPCDDLAKVKIPGATITAVKALPVGGLQEIEVFGIPPLPTSAAYCRVNATLTPTPSSAIQVEVWLPLEANWNGKFMATGNGGYGGSMGGPRLAMRPAVQGRLRNGRDRHGPHRGRGRRRSQLGP
jgi:hypothetical protein